MKIIEKQFKEFPIAIPEKTKQKILKEAQENIKEENLNELEKIGDNNVSLNIGEGNTRFDVFLKFDKKNPKIPVDDALDSLSYPKNLTNRFLYTKAKMFTKFLKTKIQDLNISINCFLTDLLAYLYFYLCLPFA